MEHLRGEKESKKRKKRESDLTAAEVEERGVRSYCCLSTQILRNMSLFKQRHSDKSGRKGLGTQL